MRSIIRRTAAAVSAAALILAAVGPAGAAWTSSKVSVSFLLSRPSLRVDSADHTGIAFQRTGGSAGIYFTTDATGGWVSGRVTSGADFTPSLRFDAANKAHIAFARVGGSAGIYVTDNVGGTWSTPTEIAADLDPTTPSLAIDTSGHQGVAYTSNYSFAPGLYFLTNATGTWVRTRVTTGTWDDAASLQFDAAGHAHILFARYAPDGPGIYYVTNATGSWVTTRLTTTYDDSPSFLFDGAGKIHAAFRRFASGAEGAYSATNVTGTWVITLLPRGSLETFGPPSIGLDPNGNPHVVVNVAHGQAGSYLVHFVQSNGVWQASSDQPLDLNDGDEFPSLAFRSNGDIEAAFRRIYPSAGIRLWKISGSSVLLVGSSWTGAPAIDIGPSNVRNISYNRRDGDAARTIDATGTGVGWTFSIAGTGNPSNVATDIATDGNGKVRILDRGHYYSNATGPWTSDTVLPDDSDGEVAVDAAGHTHLLYQIGVSSDWTLEYQTDASGSWTLEEPEPSWPNPPQPSIALDPSGKPHIAWIYPGNGGLAVAYQNRIAGFWSPIQVVLTGTNAWPSIAVDGAGKVHIAVVHEGSAAGIYYITNKTGSWVSTRLTHSFSDGAPSIDLDSTGHVYIATTRASWAADPGVYVMTNVSGSWTKARVVSTADAGDVSLGVTGSGLARIVFPSSSGILEYENSTTSLSTSTVNGLVRQQLALTADGELSARVASSSVQPAGGFGMRSLGEEVARTTGPSKPERPH